MGLTRKCLLFADAVIGAHWLVEDRIGSHPVQCLAARRGWNEEGMGKTGKWRHHEVVDLGSDEEEESPLQADKIPCTFEYVKAARC